MALTIVNRENSYTAEAALDVDAEDVVVSLIHDWGMVVVDEATATETATPGTYSYDFSDTDMISSGVHKIVWSYTVSAAPLVKNQYVEVVQRYVDKTAFFIKYPDLHDEFEPFFESLESVSRKIIDTFCGQNFQFVSDGTLTFEGNGTKNLFLGRRLDEFSTVLIDEDDVSVAVSGFSDDDFDRFLKIEYSESVAYSRFTDGETITVTGNWGYPYIPSAISTAAEMLILELMNDDRINYTHGIDQIWMDTQRTEFKDGMFDTTGNLDVDTLIMDYMIVGFDYV